MTAIPFNRRLKNGLFASGNMAEEAGDDVMNGIDAMDVDAMDRVDAM